MRSYSRVFFFFSTPILVLGLSFPFGPAHAQDQGLFQPPSDREIPQGPFGDMVRRGEKIFTHTGQFAKRYVGNDLTCESCHLDRGRKPYAAPLWAAFVGYPRFRSKNHKVSRLGERIQDCFRFSMNGTPPSLHSDTVRSLVAYAFWMSRGAPVGTRLKGQGMLRLPPPRLSPDPLRGKKVYAARCALCHAPDGQGTASGRDMAFPPVWGPRSYNQGAGLAKVAKLAGFIKMNMPLSKGDSLKDQDAWDVAAYIDNQSRPPKPRPPSKP